MNYEEKYKEALKSIRDLYNKMKYLSSTDALATTVTLENTFPELSGSEDERIRKEIIQSIRDNMCVIHKDKCIAWLEKRDTKLQEYINEERNKKDFYCEGKEMSWNEMPLDVRKHDYPYYFKGDLDCYPFNIEKQSKQKPKQDTEIHDLWVYIREWNDKFGRLPKDEDELAACIDYVMKRQKLAEWSEEDEEMYNEVLTDIIYTKNDLKTKGCLGLSKRAMKAFNWFSKRHKSLRPQSKWKPSEEQLTALKNAIIGKRGPLYDLYFDLEKL